MIHRALVLSIATLLMTAGVTHAALTSEGCLAKKLTAWANLRKCQGTAEAKQLLGKTADFTKCQTKFEAKLAATNDKATAAGVPCRYRDNGNTTITDYDTGLQWEQKITGGDFHRNLDTTVTWNDAMSEIVSAMNNWSNVANPIVPGLAGYNDWRLPNSEELGTILDPTAPGCGFGSACIDPIFGATRPGPGCYWTATTSLNAPTGAWCIHFNSIDDQVSGGKNYNGYYVRAVRSAL